jgi:hypothetical protein
MSSKSHAIPCIQPLKRDSTWKKKHYFWRHNKDEVFFHIFQDLDDEGFFFLPTVDLMGLNCDPKILIKLFGKENSNY